MTFGCGTHEGKVAVLGKDDQVSARKQCLPVAVAALLVGLDLSRGVAVGILSGFAVAALVVDAIRLTSPGANVLFFKAFGGVGAILRYRVV